MITHLSGTIEEVRLDKAVIDVSGVGYSFFATPPLCLLWLRDKRLKF